MNIPIESIRHRIYAFLDPASGKKQKGQVVQRARARSAIVVIAVDSLFRIFVLHVWADRVSPSAIRSKVLEINRAYRPRLFGIESSAQQYLFVDLVGQEARRLGQRLNLIPVDQPTTMLKDDRIRNTIEPLLTEGRLFLQQDQIELQQEIEGFPTARTKDIIDALASAVNLAPKPKPRSQARKEIQDLASYLRSQGLPPSYIEERISEIVAKESLVSSY